MPQIRAAWKTSLSLSLAAVLASTTAALAQTRPADVPPTRLAPTARALPAATLPSALRPTATQESHYSRGGDAEIQFQEGVLRYSSGQLPGAEQDFRQLVQADPGDSEAYYYLGLSQLDQNRPGEAVPNFNQSLRIDPTRDEARAARATALIRLGHLDEAQADVNVIRQNPRFATLANYLQGQIQYAKGDLEGASKSFATARASGGTEAAPAGFYEGLTYLRMKNLVQARSVFQNTSLSPDRDPSLIAASQQLDAVLAAQQQRNKPYEVQITAGYEFDSNVIQLGTDVQTPQGISSKSDGRFVVSPRGSYSFLRNDKLEIGIEGSGYFTWQNQLTDFDIDSYQAGPFINYKLADNLYASARYAFNYVELGYNPFLTRNVVTPQITYVEPKFGYTSAYYQFQARQFSGDPGERDATDNFHSPLDRDGLVHSVGLVQGFNLPELFSGAGPANLELSYRFDYEDTKGSDYRGEFNTVGATLYTPLPFWKLRFDLGATADYQYYNDPNSLDFDARRRQDYEFVVATGVTKQINDNVAIRVDYNFTDHPSNVENKTSSTIGIHPYTFDRHVVGVRMIFSF